MSALFIANTFLDKNEGIYKKIMSEAEAIGNIGDGCILLMKDKNGTLLTNIKTTETIHYDTSVLQTAKKLIENEQIDILYIRIMVPCFSLIQLMKTAKKRKIKVYYEIPTYPYYAEQIRASRKKYRAIAKVLIDIIFSPLINIFSDYIVVIRSNSKLKIKRKMIEMTNGIKPESIKGKSYDKSWDGVFRMVTVGTIYPYHGYDRILAGLANCHEQIDNIPVEFHVIGDSHTILQLKNCASEMGLRRVFFHGIKTTEELNKMFDSFDVGLGCLALHRRNADTDTTLKLIEYYCRGIPVVTSGISPYKDDCVTILVPNNNTPIDIRDIYHNWKAIPSQKLIELSVNAKKQFDWNTIFKKLLREISG